MINDEQRGQDSAQFQDEDIVKLILAERKAKEEGANPSQIKTSVITNDTFFTDNNPLGCMSKQEFIDSILNELTTNDLKEYNMFLQKLSKGERVNFKPLAWIKNGKAWYFCAFNYSHGEQRYKIPAIGQTDTFLTFYQIGVLSCNISLQGLREVALN